MRRLYGLAAGLAGPPLALAAALKGRFGGRWTERFGLKLSPARVPGRPRIWFHGASVGEARSAASVIRALWDIRPDAEVYLSVGTPAGFQDAAARFTGERRATVLAAPLDFWGSPRRAAARLKPDVLVIMETELWPNLIYEADRAGVGLVLAAARLSERSFRRYKLVRGLAAEMLERFDLIAPSGPREAELYQALGAPAARMEVLGNPKFDGLLESVKTPKFEAERDRWADILGLDSSIPLIVAGSTHPGEEEIVLDAFKSLDRPARLLLAPRHLARVPETLKLAESRGLKAVTAGGDRAAAVTVLDSMGHLPVLYALAEAAVVGGSLLPGLSGHNPLEPAAAGRPVVFGPRMSSFAREAADLLECGGALEATPETLGPVLKALLDDPEAARAAGEAARACLAARPKAAPALAEAVLKIAESAAVRTGRE